MDVGVIWMWMLHLDADIICLKREGHIGSFWTRMLSKMRVSSVPCISSIELEICGAYLNHWEAYKKTVKSVITSARAAIVKAQALIQDNEQKLANEEEKLEELDTAKSLV